MRTYTEIIRDMKPFFKELSEICGEVTLELGVSEKQFDEFDQALKQDAIDHEGEDPDPIIANGNISIIHNRKYDI